MQAQDSVTNNIDSYRENMIKSMSEMIAIPSISPSSGGEGEAKRADMLESLLGSFGMQVKRYDYKDGNFTRSNLISKYGNKDSTIWILSHIDTVSTGDLSLWEHDPFKAYIDKDKIYGRGTTDNGQSAIASIYALKALMDSKANLKYNFGLALVADEEVGSTYGVQALMKEEIFKNKDMVVVPDWGTSDGSGIEIAEKGILWLKVSVKGKQVHASTPELGINAYKISNKFLNEADIGLHKKYAAENALFDPKISTFEMTKHEKNVDSINIIPGLEVSYMDCRILPEYGIDDILEYLNGIANQVCNDTGAEIKLEAFNREDPAVPTAKDSEIVVLLSQKIKELRNVEPKFTGIGGGTVAKYFRDIGMPVAVWSTCDDIAHVPNEYCKISNMVNDAKVFASLFL
ncbi:M20 family metallo-hydrolase [Candidatus Marsarchaeota archaeon]|nr:M20 family metallo-hydrolase [Candidatus Marsarchaeota archaeon]MCL5092895.1 M20 family metallo-hydrolase [Candidatus Marsarchaeota archaeon]